MKTLVLFLLLAGLGTVRGDDNLLKNGDFSDGLAHWYGDAKLLDSASANAGGSGQANGAVIKLRGHDWTRVSQDFEVKSGTYKLHVTLALAPDLHFSTQFADYINLRGKLNFQDKHPIDADPGQWVLVVTNSNDDALCWRVTPSASQSYTFTVKGIDFNSRQTLSLAFPPGDGSVTVKEISLVLVK
jgi:hypothetical protein